MVFDRARRFSAPLAAGLLLAAVPIASSGSARAESTSARRELARELMKRGNQLRAAQDFKGALDAFRAADEIMHVPTTGFEVARSEVQLGRLVEARDMLMRVERIPVQPDEPQAFKDARQYAGLLEVEIGPRIPKIRLHVDAAAASGVALAVDGEGVPGVALDIGYAVDPGTHTVVASAPDGRTSKQEVTVNEGEERDVLLVLPRGTPSEARAPSPPPPIAIPRTVSSNRRALSWIAFSATGGATLVGAVAGTASWEHERSASARCNGNQCPPSTYADIESARTLATVSTVSFIIAGVAAVVGVVNVLIAPGAAPKPSAPGASAGAIQVRIGPTGVTGTF